MRVKRILLAAFFAMAGGAAVAFYGRLPAGAAPPIPGMVRQTEIRVAPEIGGRLVSIAVLPGQHVRRGDLLAVIENPDLSAAVGEAQAASASATADRARVFSGVRAEEVAIAGEAVRTAQANLLLAREQQERAVKLAAQTFLSRQKLDESIASLAKAQADLDLKRAQHAAVVAGPTVEERRLAEARVALSVAALRTRETRLAKTKLLAPVDGTVGIRVAEPGEILSPGKPVMTLDMDGVRWFAFTLREDALYGLAIGSTVPVLLAGGRRIDARITELRPLGAFATWRAARAVGDHDLNSFRLRLEPVAETGGLQPGMEAWLATTPP